VVADVLGHEAKRNGRLPHRGASEVEYVRATATRSLGRLSHYLLVLPLIRPAVAPADEHEGEYEPEDSEARTHHERRRQLGGVAVRVRDQPCLQECRTRFATPATSPHGS
jgi:hypothetical protein